MKSEVERRARVIVGHLWIRLIAIIIVTLFITSHMPSTVAVVPDVIAHSSDMLLLSSFDFLKHLLIYKLR